MINLNCQMGCILYQIFKIILSFFLKEIAWKHENKITKDINGENVPYLEITEVILVYCNIVNNDYQHDLRVLYTFVLNKPFGSLLEIFPKNKIFLKTLF